MFSKILIANRGEIACRVARTARRLGIATVAVYSDADAGALHTIVTDEARHIGGARANESYLVIGNIVEAARATGADAVHPGYGFLSENAGFAEACAEAGLAFIGPPSDAIRAMGSKIESKRLMEQADVPILPGYHGDDQDPEVLKREAGKIGYPVLIKASAGGGGRGMRIVGENGAFDDALVGAKREAKAGFGDETMLIEKYLASSRHVEIQIFADGDGNTVHLFERDCSIQRRHQKVIEEAPAPGMTPEMRAAMGGAAIAAAQSIDYVGAGTVEFLVEAERMGSPDAFYFMEMNTRLQVEHPVTEMVTGLDLVEWQIRVAAGEALPLAQDEIALAGHAIEARLYAEDPRRNFMPSPGKLEHLRFPREDANVRIDAGVREGDEVTVHYDPMIAKVIAWDTDRDAALARLRRALGEIEIVGPATNLAFLYAATANAAFARGEVDTGFIERHRDDVIPEIKPATTQVLALAALAELLRRAEAVAETAAEGVDPHSPWQRIDGWRLNDRSYTELRFLDGAETQTIRAHFEDDHYVLDLAEDSLRAQGDLRDDGTLLADLDGARIAASVVAHGDERIVFTRGHSHRLVLVDPLAATARHDASGGRLTAPMPGRIISIEVAEGDSVQAGQQLMVLEAMKMEHTISAPASGTVAAIRFAVGDQVPEGAELIAFETAD